MNKPVTTLNQVVVDLLRLAAAAWAAECPNTATRLARGAWEVVGPLEFVDDDAEVDR
jgi:hypothetical protein